MSSVNKQFSLLSISISDCQEILSLGQYTPEDVVDLIFSQVKTGSLNRDGFVTSMKSAFEKLVSNNSKFPLEDVVSRVFDVCAQGSSSITVEQLGKGVGVFTTKRLQSNPVKDLFFAIDKELKSVVGETAISAFLADAEKRGVNTSGASNAISDFKSKVTQASGKFELSYWGFHVWRKHDALVALLSIASQVQVTKQSPTPFPQKQIISFSDQVSKEQQIEVKKEKSIESPNNRNQNQNQWKPVGLTSFDDFINLRNRLGFQTLDPKQTLELIRSQIGHIDSLRLDEFITFFCNLFKGRYENYYEFVDGLTKIFQFIDVDGNGILDLGEFLQAIVHLFGGSEIEKISAAFTICDVDASGFLDFEEVQAFIYSTIRLAKNKSYTSLSDTEKEELKTIAYATTKDVFSKMDLDNNAKISFEEFMTWYKGGSQGIDADEKEGAKIIREARLKDLKKNGQLPLSEQEKKDKEEELLREASDPNVFLKTIEEFRSTVAFDKIHIQTAVQLVITSFENRSCDFKKFATFLKNLCETSNVPGKENAGKIALQLFNLLDSNKNGMLDVAEIGTGLGLLCGGNTVEKIRAGFDLYDEDNSGLLDFREVTNFMSGFFKIICKNPPKSLSSYTPDKLGKILAVKCFEDMQLPLDGALHFDAFREWLGAK